MWNMQSNRFPLGSWGVISRKTGSTNPKLPDHISPRSAPISISDFARKSLLKIQGSCWRGQTSKPVSSRNSRMAVILLQGMKSWLPAISLSPSSQAPPGNTQLLPNDMADFRFSSTVLWPPSPGYSRMMAADFRRGLGLMVSLLPLLIPGIINGSGASGIQQFCGMEGRKTNMYSVKVIVIGDSGVGKTNLITRFCENHFKDTYVATIGVDFKIKSLPIGDKIFKLQIWDTAGQERFKNITQTYYKGAAGIVLVYSITDPVSFSNMEKWITQIDNNCTEDVSKVLVATKHDLAGERKVSTEEGRKLAETYGIPFLEVSAKSGHQVKEAFEALGKEIVKKQEEKGEIAGFQPKKNILRAGEPQKKCAC